MLMTVIAQVLNFLILVWLMKRFLYKPIRDAIDAREQRIATELAEAAATKAEAEKERGEFRKKNEHIDLQRALLLSEATDEAAAERQRLMDEARQAAEAVSAKRQEANRKDAQNLNQAIAQRTQQEVFAIARKVLADLAGASLEAQMGEVFIRRLRAMADQEKEAVGGAIKASSAPVLVCSAFDLPQEQRAAIQQAINETFAADIQIRFKTAPDVISGIELTANGQKVAWSIAEYLVSLKTGVDELLQDHKTPATQSDPESEAPTPEAKRS